MDETTSKHWRLNVWRLEGVNINREFLMASAESARVAPKPLPTPFTLLDADDDDDETAGDSPSFNQAASDVALALVEAPRRSLQMASREAGPPHALGGQMAHRVLRDALALQLARRGFDGLRNTALWLVAELAADFIKALGAQLAAQPAATPAATVRRLQRHTNMLSASEWHQAQISFVRVAEPVGPGGTAMRGQSGSVAASVAPLYTAMRGAWNYKQTLAGRQSHQIAGQTDVPTPSTTAGSAAGLSGRELSESLRLSKKQRQLADPWLQTGSVGFPVTAPVLLPGRAIAKEAAAAAAAAAAAPTAPPPVPRGGRGGRGGRNAGR